MAEVFPYGIDGQRRSIDGQRHGIGGQRRGISGQRRGIGGCLCHPVGHGQPFCMALFGGRGRIGGWEVVYFFGLGVLCMLVCTADGVMSYGD